MLSTGISAARDLAAHVGDQRIFKNLPQLFNLGGSQLQVVNLAYSLRKLVGYVPGQGSGPFSFCDESSLRHGRSFIHTDLKTAKILAENIYPTVKFASSVFHHRLPAGWHGFRITMAARTKTRAICLSLAVMG